MNLFWNCNLLSLLIGNYLSYKFHKNQKDYTAVGASGAVSGIVYSSILIFPEMKLVFLFFPIPMPGYVFAVGYLIYTIYAMKKQNDNVGHTAHFGGSIAGIMATLLIAPVLSILSAFNVVMFSFWALVIAIVIYYSKTNIIASAGYFFGNIFFGLLARPLWDLLNPYQQNRVLTFIYPCLLYTSPSPRD